MHNLPSPAFSGVAEYVVNVEIDAPIDSVWAILIDLQSYPLWNPHNRSAVIVDDVSHKPTQDQSLRADVILELAIQMPPSLDPSRKPIIRHEHVTLVDHAAHRVTWSVGRIPTLFRGEHSHALSVSSNGKTLCETRHAIGGLFGYPLKHLMSTTVQHCLEEMSNALKQRAEGKSSRHKT